MTDTPKPWDGLPLRPEQLDHHWVGDGVWYWLGALNYESPWQTDFGHQATCAQAARYTYGGPIPSPDELAQMHVELTALRRVADAARVQYEAHGAYPALIAALDALPGQQVQP